LQVRQMLTGMPVVPQEPEEASMSPLVARSHDPGTGKQVSPHARVQPMLAVRQDDAQLGDTALAFACSIRPSGCSAVIMV
jgi:hypothetical protein